MKAIRVEQFGGPEVLKLIDIPVPRPAPGQVLVRLHAVGINPVETYIRSGTYARKPALPYTPGTDGAGVVEAVGDVSTGFEPGTRVFTSGSVTGTYAEYALCHVADVHKMPAGVSFSQGAAIGIPYATAYRALFQRGLAQSGDTVLIHGASGGVGIAAVQLGRAHGLRLLGTAGTDAGRKLIKEHGANEVFDHRTSNYLQQITAAAPQGVNVIIEMLANVNLGNDLTLLARGGRVVVVGSRGRVEIDPRDLMGRESDIRGMVLFNTPEPELKKIYAALIGGLADGSLQPVIGREFPLAEAEKAHRAIMESGALGKIVLTTAK